MSSMGLLALSYRKDRTSLKSQLRPGEGLLSLRSHSIGPEHPSWSRALGAVGWYLLSCHEFEKLGVERRIR
jgi:hypothetical protein